MRALRSLGLALGALLLTGCSAAAAPDLTPSEMSALSEQVRDALADGVVTFDEYAASFHAYKACLKDAGFTVVELEPYANGTFNTRIPSAAIDSGVDEDCYSRLYEPVDVEYQVSHEDDSETAEAIRECLRGRGLTPGDTMDELDTQMESEGIDPLDCLGS